jgi:hypothetical protein
MLAFGWFGWDVFFPAAVDQGSNLCLDRGGAVFAEPLSAYAGLGLRAFRGSRFAGSFAMGFLVTRGAFAGGFGAFSAGLWRLLSLLALSYGKTGLMALPVLGAFTVVEYFSSAPGTRCGWRIGALAMLVVCVLAVLPNLPALREARFVAMFEFGPFEGWQRAFSTKSALSWLDRDGLLGEGMDSGFAPTTLNGGTYLGLTRFSCWQRLFFGACCMMARMGARLRLLLALAMGGVLAFLWPPKRFGGAFRVSQNVAGCCGFHSLAGVVFIGCAGVGDLPVGPDSIDSLAMGCCGDLSRLFAGSRLSLGRVATAVSEHPCSV